MPSERARLVPQERKYTNAAYGSTRDAFERRDAEASREAHRQERLQKALPDHHERHGGTASEYLKSIVFGGMDGIMTIFALAASAAGAGANYQTVLIFGFANQLADAFSMGFGEFISSSAERDNAMSERDREMWEVENCFDAEVQEMIELYIKRGLSEEDATRIVQIMSKNPITFVDFMMVDELGLMVDVSDAWRPAKQGLVMFSSFVIFSCIPLLAYLIGGPLYSNDVLFAACVASTAVSLAILGSIKGYLTDVNILRSAMMMMFNGAIVGSLSFAVSQLANAILPNQDPEMLG